MQEEDAEILVGRLDTTTTKYSTEIGSESKVVTYNLNGFRREIKTKGRRLDAVENLSNLNQSF